MYLFSFPISYFLLFFFLFYPKGIIIGRISDGLFTEFSESGCPVKREGDPTSDPGTNLPLDSGGIPRSYGRHLAQIAPVSVVH